jgi:xanthine dehydrogenase accessory factor
MDRETLTAVNLARSTNKPFVLMTDLDLGDQTIHWHEKNPQSGTLDEEVRETVEKAISSDKCQLLDNGKVKLFIQPYNPELRAVVIGAVHIAQELIPLLKQCHYRVSIIDPRQTFATNERFPGLDILTDWPDKALSSLKPDKRTAIITLTHDPKLDDPALEVALQSDAFYIGALGSKKTQQSRNLRLQEKGFDPDSFRRIHGPVGLDIGAQSPAEIAIAIMAEITRVLRSIA